MKNSINTGSKVVDQMATMDITGDVVPRTWLKQLLKDTGKPYLLAIMILGQIVFWYRPSKNIETDGTVTYRKRFKADKLQISYNKLVEDYGEGKKSIKRAIDYLVQQGLITREFRNDARYKNVMFIELVPSVLEKITVSEENSNNIGNKPLTNLPDTRDKCGNTYTKIKTEKNTETTTKADVVDELISMGITEKACSMIMKAAQEDPDKVRQAIKCLSEQTSSVRNVPGFLIMAIKEDYAPVPYTPQKSKNSCHFDLERKYDFDRLEEELLSKQKHRYSKTAE